LVLIFPFADKSPKIEAESFVAENASLIGDVLLGSQSSVWFGTVLRAEVESIKVGSKTNIQDNCVVHTDIDSPTRIGDRVSIGHGAVIHGATIHSNCLIGMGSILLNGSVIGENCLVAAGSIVTQGKEMPSNTLVIGAPAVPKRELSSKEVERINSNADHYSDLRAQYLKIKS
jgi:carbonic anhydrase/acetyltransferase-like protein (isoleucine patch superfamily)